MLIDIEGTDGSGKAIQTKLLCDYLIGKGYKCCLISFPNYASRSSDPVKMYLGGEVGDDANCLDGYQASALYAVDRLITMKKIDLSQYDYVIFDRYTPSNIIHQSTRIEDQKELNNFLDWIDEFEFGKMALPRPDRILFLDMPPKYSIQLARSRSDLKNGQTKDILEADSSHLSKAYDRAVYVSERFGWTRIDCIRDERIKSIEDIHEEIKASLNL